LAAGVDCKPILQGENLRIEIFRQKTGLESRIVDPVITKDESAAMKMQNDINVCKSIRLSFKWVGNQVPPTGSSMGMSFRQWPFIGEIRVAVW